ncbi:MAG TPA: CAP domain-containing protein [Sandaracinaceae bacterium LLY-WYZ-13_1]|nr:CAP domain-containing protein [Sandaracinaceae bacterium LLY-WYZ-13_1]
MRTVLLCGLAAALTACQGSLVVEGPDDEGGGDSGVRIDWPDADTPMPMPGDDAGTPPPPPGEDAGTPPPDPECTLPDRGTCDGDTARWCDGDTERSADCASSGQVCMIESGRARCVDEEPPPPPPSECATAIEAEVIALANMARAAEGAGPLECDPDMARTARLHSQDMCDQGYFSHTGLDGRSPFDRMRDQGVSYRTAGENIARGQRTADSVHAAWMDSPGHRRNILNSSYGRIGVGYVECPGSGPYWTQVFAD